VQSRVASAEEGEVEEQERVEGLEWVGDQERVEQGQLEQEQGEARMFEPRRAMR